MSVTTSPWSSRFITVDGLQVHYLKAGPANPSFSFTQGSMVRLPNSAGRKTLLHWRRSFMSLPRT